ncbi:MAG: hypothetical protein KC731_39940 [Myxococcales bacterium]|nr:hypothetical protein [Myxococcales bacterium]
MKTMTKWGVAALVTSALGVGLLPVETEAAVTRAQDDCVTAWAVLAPGTDLGKNAVQGAMSKHKEWSASGYERGVAQKFELMIFDIIGSEDTALVAHCGAGVTCNELAEEVHKSNPNLSNPVVVCTVDNPNSLQNGRNM